MSLLSNRMRRTVLTTSDRKIRCEQLFYQRRRRCSPPFTSVLQQARYRYFRRLRRSKSNEPSVVTILSWHPFPFPLRAGNDLGSAGFACHKNVRQECFFAGATFTVDNVPHTFAHDLKNLGINPCFLQHLWMIDAERLAIVAK